MFLRNIEITISSDGFTIIDTDHSIVIGSLLSVRYLVMGEWITRFIPFDPTPTILELVVTGRRHVFVYTGGTPERVVVLDGETNYSSLDSGPTDWLYSNRNYASYPQYDSPCWSDGFLSYYLGGHPTYYVENHPQYSSNFGWPSDSDFSPSTPVTSSPFDTPPDLTSPSLYNTDSSAIASTDPSVLPGLPSRDDLTAY